jgi:DUF4097 and DUF4098 domain-containing protein YvlB
VTKTLTTLVLLAAAPELAGAGERIEQRRSAAPDGLVAIENAAGSIRVVGWDKSEVEVIGNLGDRADALEVSGGPHRVTIAVETVGNPHSVHSDLEIRVPKRSRLQIDSFAASIAVEGVDGLIEAETVNSGITIAAGSKEVRAESVNGGVEVTCPCRRVEASSVNGPVTIRGASGVVEASTVNGRLHVEGGRFERAQLESVSGGVHFEGDLDSSATLDVETVSGWVELSLPAGVSADFSISSFSGSIANEFGQEPRRISRYTSEKELEFSTGSGGASVTIHTLSGSIRLHKR